MIPMLLAGGALAAWSVLATIATTSTDGYRRQPDRMLESALRAERPRSR
jgi:hypothetical protein